MRVNKKIVLYSVASLLIIGIVLWYLLIIEKNNKIKATKIEHQLFKLESSGWKSRKYTQIIDEINYTATEVPIQYYILKNEGKKDFLKVDSIYEANKKERIYEFDIKQIQNKNLLEKKYTSLDYETTINYLSFDIEKDFCLVTSSKDTIKASGVLYERHFKTTPNEKILIFFSNIEPDEKVQLLYNDKLFRNGLLKFQFKEKYTNIVF